MAWIKKLFSQVVLCFSAKEQLSQGGVRVCYGKRAGAPYTAGATAPAGTAGASFSQQTIPTALFDVFFGRIELWVGGGRSSLEQLCKEMFSQEKAQNRRRS